MRSPRKLALTLLAVTASTLVALVAVPYLLRGRIASRIRLELDRSLNARVRWGTVSLSALRDFPNVTLTLDRLSVVGVKPFQGDTLLSVRRARLVLDAASVLRYLRSGERIVVRAVDLATPVARLRVLADGTANWDIARKSAPATGQAPRAVGLTLRDLRIRNGALALDDRHARLTASLSGLEQSLRGDFARDNFVLATRTRADTVSLRFGGVPYLSRVAVELNADIGADLRAHRFTFRDDSLRLNKLTLAFSGSVTAGDPNVALDLSFSTPSTAFADILSLVPAIYARDFARLQTSGRMSASGRVRGPYGPTAFPGFAIRARVDDGAFRYPDLPLAARDVSMDLAIDNAGLSADSTVVSLKRFHAVVGRRPLDAALVMRTPVSDPDVDLRLAGTLDLADLRRTVKLTGVSDLSGTVAADVAMRARMSQLDAGRYEQVAARGTVDVARLSLRSATLRRPVSVDSAALRLTPRRADLSTLAARIGSTEVVATGWVDNLLGFALRGDVLRGQAAVRSANVNLDEWRSDDALEVIPVPPNVDFALQASANRVTYGAVTAANVRGALRVKDRRVTLDDLRMETLRGTVVANGFYETADVAKPTFDVALRVASVDVPTAFAALGTVQKLVPVARWTQGTVSGDVALKGVLGRNMTPAFDALTGRGSIESGRLVLQGVPVMAKLAESLALEHLRNPALEALRATFEIRNGRVVVKPFDVRLGHSTMRVAGSNGIDQTLDYDLALAVPSADLSPEAGRTVARLASQAGKTGLNLSAAEVVELGARVTGTITNPTVRPNFSGVASSVGDAVKYAARRELESQTAEAKERVDSAADDARRRARAEAERIVQEAERQAASIREEARTVAAKGRDEAKARADTLEARAANPGARLAAKLAADRVRREADQQAERVVREADARADALVTEARKRADAFVKAGD